MSKKKNNEEMVAFIEGSSVIDIGAIRKAQESEPIIDDEDHHTTELTLDEEALSLKAEFDADPELKKDVLADFTESESNDNLDHLAARISKQEDEQLAHFEKVAEEVSEEMMALNQQFIAEDQVLENELAAVNATDEGLEIEEMSEHDQELRAALPQVDDSGNYDLEDLQSCIEALLFYSDRSVSLKKLKEMLEMTDDAAETALLQAIENLKIVYANSAHGFEIAEIAGGYQLRTKVSKAPLLRKLAKVQVQRLSRGAMETLTLVAYKQPCTKDDIDQVRGVDSSHFIRTLLDRKLIEITGRAEAAGRPMVYATTDTFLEVFGLMDLKGLPPLREIEAMVPQLVATEEGAEDPRVIQMRKMVQGMKAESNSLGYSAKEDDTILQEIRDRVKAIDITSPYLERQKQLAAEGIHGEEAEAILTREMGFAPAPLAEQPELPIAPVDAAVIEHAEINENIYDLPEGELNS